MRQRDVSNNDESRQRMCLATIRSGHGSPVENLGRRLELHAPVHRQKRRHTTNTNTKHAIYCNHEQTGPMTTRLTGQPAHPDVKQKDANPFTMKYLRARFLTIADLVVCIARLTSLMIWRRGHSHRRPNRSESPNRRHFASFNTKMHADSSHRRPTSQDFTGASVAFPVISEQTKGFSHR